MYLLSTLSFLIAVKVAGFIVQQELAWYTCFTFACNSINSSTVIADADAAVNDVVVLSAPVQAEEPEPLRSSPERNEAISSAI